MKLFIHKNGGMNESGLKALANALADECSPKTLKRLETALTAAKESAQIFSSVMIATTAAREVAEGREEKGDKKPPKTTFAEDLEANFARALKAEEK